MHIRVAARFNGPPDTGNGGYTAGLIASAIGEPVRVRLMRQIPLEKTLEIVSTEKGWEVRDATSVIAAAAPHTIDVNAPGAPSRVEALGASQHYTGFGEHSFPLCFVCGPQRGSGDGLRIFAGSVPGMNLLAAPWRPHVSLADADGRLRPEFLWAALDCPGYFATCSPAVALLGEMSVRIDHVPQIDEPCVIAAWAIDSDGRKHRAGTALFDEAGRSCAVGVATWIELK